MKKNIKKILIATSLLITFTGTYSVLKILGVPFYTQDFSVSVADSYVELDDLSTDSEIIARVGINSNDFFEFDEIPFTLSDANIIEVYKGSVSNDTMSILETGGILENVEYSVEGEKVLKEGDEAIIYVEKYEGPIKPEIDKYVIKGIYQGKYKIDDNEQLIASDLNTGELSEVSLIEDLDIE